jgi:macrodomain Ter protein organizer (MatP/YcbG family)
MTGKKARSVRVSDQVWQRAKEKANKQGMTVSEVIVDFLKEFIKN